jgi:hypothetical protein
LARLASKIVSLAFVMMIRKAVTRDKYGSLIKEVMRDA